MSQDRPLSLLLSNIMLNELDKELLFNALYALKNRICIDAAIIQPSSK